MSSSYSQALRALKMYFSRSDEAFCFLDFFEKAKTSLLGSILLILSDYLRALRGLCEGYALVLHWSVSVCGKKAFKSFFLPPTITGLGDDDSVFLHRQALRALKPNLHEAMRPFAFSGFFEKAKNLPFSVQSC